MLNLKIKIRDIILWKLWLSSYLIAFIKKIKLKVSRIKNKINRQ